MSIANSSGFSGNFGLLLLASILFSSFSYFPQSFTNLKNIEEIYKNYPMLKIHSDLYHTDRNKNEVEFKTYISFVNQQNSVDFSKI